jgi:UDP-N-acetyl-D-mannosaminuronic acid dehydrogenase
LKTQTSLEKILQEWYNIGQLKEHTKPNMKSVLFIGLGRIGLPQALVFASKGFKVYGFDQDPKIPEQLKKGILPFYEPGMQELLTQHLGENFLPSAQTQDLVTALTQSDALFFTLGTGVPNSQTCKTTEGFDLSPIYQLLQQLLQHPLKKASVLVFRTTLALGSMDRIKSYIEQNFPLTEGNEFHLAFIPERLVEGQAISEEEHLPKIVGTYNDQGYEKITTILKQLGGKIIRVRDPKTAEFCKLTDNSYRNTLFSFANELALSAADNHIDALEVIHAVNADYARNNIPKPGYASGYCLGKDPYIFEYSFQNISQNRGFDSLWYYGRRINDWLIDYTVDKINKNLKNKNGKIVILGTSFKEDIDDFRMSHSLDLAKALISVGYQHITFFDPNMDLNKYTQLPENLQNCQKTKILDSALFENAEAIIIAHRHQLLRQQNAATQLQALLKKAHQPVYIFDGWNIWREAATLPFVHYEALGYALTTKGSAS